MIRGEKMNDREKLESLVFDFIEINWNMASRYVMNGLFRSFYPHFLHNQGWRKFDDVNIKLPFGYTTHYNYEVYRSCCTNDFTLFIDPGKKPDYFHQISLFKKSPDYIQDLLKQYNISPINYLMNADARNTRKIAEDRLIYLCKDGFDPTQYEFWDKTFSFRKNYFDRNPGE